MEMLQKTLEWLKKECKGGKFENPHQAAAALGLSKSEASKFYKALNQGTMPRIDSFLPWLEAMGAKIVFPGSEADQQEHAREVCFVNPRIVSAMEGAKAPESEDYLAVPLAAEAVAAGPGRIPSDDIRGWVLVWRHHESVRFKVDLVAVEIGKNETSMTPLFNPGDMLLIDKSDRDPNPSGKIMLVCEPGQEGGCMIKRVSMKKKNGDYELTFYSENSRDNPPVNHMLRADYDNELNRAIGGTVIWAWSDVRGK